MLKKIPEIFLKPFPYWEKIDFFRKVLYVFLLLNALSLLPIATEAFGYHGIVGTGGWNTAAPWYQQGSKGLLNILSHPINSTYPWLAYIFVYGQIAALIAGIFNVWPKIMAVIIYFLTANLFVKGYLMFTGGEALISILLFYLMFLQRSDCGKQAEPYFSPLQNVMNNTFYWIILIQICVVYFFSTLYKLIDPFWVNGEALMHIAKIDAFSGDSMRYLFANNPIFSVVGTYLVLAYQGLFPVLVWVKKVKIPFLILGVIIHLGISIGMGIFTFGITMILTYILFLDTEQLRKLRLFKKKKATV